jgi:hypothetical protein
MDGDHSVKRRGRWVGLTALALVSTLAGWLLFGRADGREAEMAVVVPQPEPPPAEPVAPPAPPPAAPRPAPPPAAATPPAPAAAPEPPPSHPITPEHLRIQLENQFIQAMNDAMDLREGARLRKLASQYREHHFEDVDKLGEGYDIVANCLMSPGEPSRAAAQAFFERERASILRRHVKRHCLE